MSTASPVTPEDAARWRDELDRDGRRLVFTSGCFDILHAGHVRYLRQARDLGDALIVALNSDDSVRRLKGPARPVNSQEDRAEVLLGLAAVDAVVIFDDDRTVALLRAIRPHIFAKGGDYTEETLHPAELAVLRETGAEIRILPEVRGRSTTTILSRMASPPPRLPRIGVLGSGNGSNFEAIAAAIDEQRLTAAMAVVISDNADARILERARRRNIPAVHVDPGPWRTRLGDAAQQEICRRLQDAGVDLVVCAGFMRILKEPILSAFAGRIVNIHPSLLPAFPGRSAIADALAAGVPETGCTVHLVDAGIDTGPVLAQSRVPVLPDDTEESLASRIHAAEHALLPAAIQDLLQRLAAPQTPSRSSSQG